MVMVLIPKHSQVVDYETLLLAGAQRRMTCAADRASGTRAESVTPLPIATEVIAKILLRRCRGNGFRHHFQMMAFLDEVIQPANVFGIDEAEIDGVRNRVGFNHQTFRNPRGDVLVLDSGRQHDVAAICRPLGHDGWRIFDQVNSDNRQPVRTTGNQCMQTGRQF